MASAFQKPGPQLVLLALLVVIAVGYSQFVSSRLREYETLFERVREYVASDEPGLAAECEEQLLLVTAYLPEKTRVASRRDSLSRLWLYRLADGDIEGAIASLNELVDIQDNANPDKLLLEQLRTCESVKALAVDKQQLVFNGAASRAKAAYLAWNFQIYDSIDAYALANRCFDEALGVNNIMSIASAPAFLELKGRNFCLEAGDWSAISVIDGTGESVEKLAIEVASENTLGQGHLHTLRIRCAYASFLESLGKRPSVQAAVEIFDGVVDMLDGRSDEDSLQLKAFALQQEGFCHSRSGRFADANNCHERATQLVTSLYGAGSIEMAELAFIRSDTFTTQATYTQGDRLLSEYLCNLEILEADQSSIDCRNRCSQNRILHCMADMQHRIGKFRLYSQADRTSRIAAAKACYLESKDLLERIGYTRSLRYAYVNRDLCEVETWHKQYIIDLDPQKRPDPDSGRFERASEYIGNTRKLFNELYGTGVKQGAYLLNTTIEMRCLTAWGHYDEAVNTGRAELVELVDDQVYGGDANAGQYANVLRKTGNAYAAKGETQNAIDAFALAIDLYSRNFFQQMVTSNEDKAAASAERLRDCLKDMIAALWCNDDHTSNQCAQVFEYVSSVKGMVARTHAFRAEHASVLSSDLEERINANSKAVSGLGMKIYTSEVPKPEDLEELKVQHRIRNELQKEAVELMPVEHIRFESDIVSRLDSALPEQSSFVEIYRNPKNTIEAEDVYFAFVLNKRDGIQKPDIDCVRIGNAQMIDNAIAKLDVAVKSGKDFAASGSGLRELTWDVIRPLVGNGKKVVVAGDGEMTRIPWVGLPSGIEGRFLLDEDFLFCTAPGSRDYVDSIERIRKPGTGSLLVGVSEFGDPAVKNEYGFSFPELKFSKEEFENADVRLRKLGAPVVRLIDERATLAAIMKEMPERKFLHIATHGYTFPVENDQSEMFPYASSFLALHLANKSTAKRPRVLTADTVIRMNLANLELVILSACSSQSGLRRSGEGVYGMQRAFLLAGTESCLATLRDLNDEDASKFTKAFCEHWLEEGLSKSEALRSTQRELRDDMPPGSWSNWSFSGAIE